MQLPSDNLREKWLQIRGPRACSSPTPDEASYHLLPGARRGAVRSLQSAHARGPAPFRSLPVESGTHLLCESNSIHQKYSGSFYSQTTLSMADGL